MNEDFLDFMRCMNQFGVQFILVGGYAYMYNVQARFTADIDFWVCPTQENLARLQKATWEFMGLEFDVDEVLALLQTSRLGFRLAGVKPNLIEVLLRVSGIPDFDQAYAQAKVTQDSGVTFRVLHPGGYFLFCSPSDCFDKWFIGGALFGAAYRNFFQRISRHHHCDSPATWQARLERHGFEVERIW